MRGEKFAYDFKELAFHFVFPAFALQFICDTEYLVDSAGNHAGCGVSLQARREMSDAENIKTDKNHTDPPSMVKDFPEPVWP